MPRAGACAKAVTSHVEALRREQQLDTQGEALAALAVNLAKKLDVGEPMMMTASWARELRMTLAALSPREAADDGDDDSWLAGLPAAVRDTEES
jgi:hypothetical protein